MMKDQEIIDLQAETITTMNESVKTMERQVKRLVAIIMLLAGISLIGYAGMAYFAFAYWGCS